MRKKIPIRPSKFFERKLFVGNRRPVCDASAAGILDTDVVTNEIVISQMDQNSGNSTTLAGTTTGTAKRPLEWDVTFSFRKPARSKDNFKGLRYFTKLVCDKMRHRGISTLNEITDELIQEYFDSVQYKSESKEKRMFNEKNIRRRVYDSMNVLMATNVVYKDKKDFRWVGIPTAETHECKKMEEERSQSLDRIRRKREQMHDLMTQLVGFKSLVERNKLHEQQHGKPLPDSVIYLPCVVFHTDKDNTIDCNVSNNKAEYVFSFHRPFEVHDDVEILKRLGLTHGLGCTEVDPVDVPIIKSYLPESLGEYVDQIAEHRFFPNVSTVPQPELDRAIINNNSLQAPFTVAFGTVNRNFVDAKKWNPDQRFSSVVNVKPAVGAAIVERQTDDKFNIDDVHPSAMSQKLTTGLHMSKQELEHPILCEDQNYSCRRIRAKTSTGQDTEAITVNFQ